MGADGEYEHYDESTASPDRDLGIEEIEKARQDQEQAEEL